MNFRFCVNELGMFRSEYKNDFNFFIDNVSTLSNPQNNTLIFVKYLDAINFEKILQLRYSIIILNHEASNDKISLFNKHNLVLKVNNPRLEFAKMLSFILEFDNSLEEDIEVKKKFVVGKNVNIGHDCEIKQGVVINDNVQIGNNVVIRENAVIGGLGFGFEREEDGTPVRLPHIGGVIIGDNVEIGALTTVASGTIEPTLIGTNTKIDDHVHVAHNCVIGKNVLICAGAKLCGSVNIEDNVWVGAGAIIMQSKKVGLNAYIGMGAVVKSNVGQKVEVSGNPAKPLSVLAKEKIVMTRAKKFFNDKGECKTDE